MSRTEQANLCSFFPFLWWLCERGTCTIFYERHITGLLFLSPMVKKGKGFGPWIGAPQYKTFISSPRAPPPGEVLRYG